MSDRYRRDTPPWGHPRRRGEHADSGQWLQPTRGSSPQARGTSITIRPNRPVLGVIPAGAGNIGSSRRLIRANWGHPRRRGEHGFRHHRAHACMGSSPQARGTFTDFYEHAFSSGVIPAGAGNISPRRPDNMLPRGHPRRRGEHWVRVSRWVGRGGSSPQARGTCSPT